MTEQNPHRHTAVCRERAKFATCGVVPHEHLANACYDRDGRLTCHRRAGHQHDDTCYPWLYNCGYPA